VSICGTALRTSTPLVARGRRCACRPWAAASWAGSRWLGRRRTLVAALRGAPSGVLALPRVRSARHGRRTVRSAQRRGPADATRSEEQVRGPRLWSPSHRLSMGGLARATPEGAAVHAGSRLCEPSAKEAPAARSRGLGRR
jgi:hypothetical protein